LQIGARKHQVNTAETELRNANENVDRYAETEFPQTFLWIFFDFCYKMYALYLKTLAYFAYLGLLLVLQAVSATSA